MQLDRNTEAEKAHDRATKWIDGIEAQQKRDKLRREIIEELKFDQELLEQALEATGSCNTANIAKQISNLLQIPIPLTDRTTAQIAISNLQMAVLLDVDSWIEHRIDKELGQ